MWLLNTSTLQLEEFWGAEVLRYAILSHTWAQEELTFHEIQNVDDTVQRKIGFTKVTRFCELAKSHEFGYGWVDSCCIDKRSSAELTEAINSMFKWYSGAGLCIVYLSDVPGLYGDDACTVELQAEAFRKSRWFTRGWTLQELIACNQRRFFAHDWSLIDQERWEHDIVRVCSEVTGVDERVLRDSRTMPEICIAERMSWAARRETTRPEDSAYSLMGIFDVNMAILYGEGLRGAFRRLQTEIMKTSFDQTLFAWGTSIPAVACWLILQKTLQILQSWDYGFRKC